MMMKTAGGPGLVSPIDFGERRKPLPRWVLGAIGASLLVHGAVGVALYTQRFEMVVPAPMPEGPIIEVDMFRPKPPPIERTDPAPPAPTPPIHIPTTVQPTPDTLTVTPSDDPAPAAGPVVNLTNPVAPDATGTAATPDVPARGPALITNPTWLRKPTGAQLMDAYPERALNRDMSGSATLRCAVRLDGSLTGCSVLAETPGGYGFGRSALSLSRYFRMNPGAVDGQAIDGARVDVGVRFTLPEG